MPNRAKSLILCVHAHQPVGNFDSVFLDAYEKCYKPFFEVLAAHPSFPMSCHWSGSLMDWLEANKPEFLVKLKAMSDRGQIEFLGGAYYEPIYGAIPEKDLIGQIEMMRAKLKNLFGKAPTGAWLTERVWDPHLVRPLRKTGVEYTVLDDHHFEKAGVSSPVSGFYQAKDGLRSLDLFASIKHLRYLMPFRKAEDTLDYIHSLDVGPEDALVFADDCEKFGLWPGTYGWVYKQKWLDQLLTLLEKDSRISLYTFERFRKQHRSKRSVKVPHASYSEMMTWSGGSFDNFFAKYPESGYMRDRMRGVSAALQKRSFPFNGKGAAYDKAKHSLYRAQCNCSYWHGVFGGLYLHHLRSAVFENLIKADREMSETLPASKRRNNDVEVLKMESGERWLVKQKEISLFFNPHYGGALEELDYIPMSVNLMCNLQRQREPYHQAVLGNGANGHLFGGLLSIYQMLGSKEKNLEKHLFYDPLRRLSFMDHFFAHDVTLEDFNRSSYEEIGDFAGAPYKPSLRPVKGHTRLCLERQGHLKIHDKTEPLTLLKTVVPKGPACVQVHYHFKNTGHEALRFTFGAEFNFSIGETQATKGLSEKKIKEWIFNDSWRRLQLKLSSDSEMALLATPVETISESEAGLEKVFQQLAVLLQRPMFLKPKETKECVLELEVR